MGIAWPIHPDVIVGETPYCCRSLRTYIRKLGALVIALVRLGSLCPILTHNWWSQHASWLNGAPIVADCTLFTYCTWRTVHAIEDWAGYSIAGVRRRQWVSIWACQATSGVVLIARQAIGGTEVASQDWAVQIIARKTWPAIRVWGAVGTV